MGPSARGLIMLPMTCLLLFGLTLSLASPGAKSETSSLSLQRHKRHWVWNSFYVQEERDPPYHFMKLHSNKSNIYTIYKIDGDGAGKIFTVDPSGDVYAQEKLDREKKSSYRLKARLIDTRTNQQVDNEEEFDINVSDLNDNNPVFLQDFKGSVVERSPKGTLVMTVTATDYDDPTTPNGNLEYKLLNGTDLFTIDEGGNIRTRIDYLDREKQSMYKISVQAKDMPGMNSGNINSTTVTINVLDINDNMAVFKKSIYSFNVKEDAKQNSKIGIMELEDRDEEQNKDPSFTVLEFPQVFMVVKNPMKDGLLTLMQELDYEKKDTYNFVIEVKESGIREPADNRHENLIKRAEVMINVIDIDEPPLFTEPIYNFSIKEHSPIKTLVGKVSAKDPDRANFAIQYHIDDQNCPIAIDPTTGVMTVAKDLDRELVDQLEFTVTAVEANPKGLKSQALVKVFVLDINDNNPQLTAEGMIFACEADPPGTIIGRVKATDRDEHKEVFTIRLAKPSYNFTLTDNKDNTANITVRHGDFNQDDPLYHLVVEVVDSGYPTRSSTTTIDIPVCSCDSNRKNYYCKAAPTASNASFHALIAIILCILTILVIVILFILRKRWQKKAAVILGKNGEIHEQLVSYDEEGGGEMDTNGYDVSILNSARNDGAVLPPPPGVYAAVNKPPAVRRDMATMIEVKKDEADHERDGGPYDTLHIYGYEGPESLVGSFSSLESRSDDASLDYDILNDWGPRFKTLAELYGIEPSENQYTY
ncbi:cadherin-5 [Brienomyrus brachyistius]|uniref:cadherin-5 n=1 Tax=Brienomyrus brachyistius TaxID=42636 RepID=UPI0020B423C0|nr:cadherin-5 [Brienomyrus brachyistius]